MNKYKIKLPDGGLTIIEATDLSKARRQLREEGHNLRDCFLISWEDKDGRVHLAQ